MKRQITLGTISGLLTFLELTVYAVQGMETGCAVLRLIHWFRRCKAFTSICIPWSAELSYDDGFFSHLSFI